MPGTGFGQPQGFGGQQDPNALFNEVQRLMGLFEAMSPRFQAAAQQAAAVQSQLQPGEAQLLSGQVSQAMHHRFVGLQQRAVQIGGEGGAVQPSNPGFAGFVGELSSFVRDFEQHNHQISAVVEKVEGLLKGQGGAPPMGIPGSLPPMGGGGSLPPMPGSGLPSSLPPRGSSPPSGLPPLPGGLGETALPSGGGLPPLPPAGASGLPPLPGSGGLPPMPGGGGLPPMPGGPGAAASQGGAPRGVFGGEMPALGGGGGRGMQQTDPLDVALQSIMKVMGELEQCTGQIRGRATQLQSLTLPRDEQVALEDTSLDGRFQKLVAAASKFGSVPPDAAFIAETERFNQDLVAHSDMLWRVCSKLGIEKSAMPLPVNQRPPLPARADL